MGAGMTIRVFTPIMYRCETCERFNELEREQRRRDPRVTTFSSLTEALQHHEQKPWHEIKTYAEQPA